MRAGAKGRSLARTPLRRHRRQEAELEGEMGIGERKEEVGGRDGEGEWGGEIGSERVGGEVCDVGLGCRE